MQIPWRSPPFSFLQAILPIAILMFGLGRAQAATTYYVAPGGNDAKNCLSPATACRTITRVLNVPALDGDTVSIAAGSYSSGFGEIFPLTINMSLTLTGAGALSTKVDATGVSQNVLTIRSGATVTINGITITGGNLGNAAGGGGVRNTGILTLNDSVVSGNTGNGGGGIVNEATLTLNNSTVSGNDGGNGVGGIYNFGGALTLSNSTVSGNKARGEAGIRNTGGTMSLNNSTVSNNTATHNITGGILNDCANTTGPATATLTNSTVSGNSAVSYGGGIVNLNDTNCSVTITLNNSTVTNNTAADGGGIIQDPRNTSSSNASATVKLKNTIVAGNKGNPNPNCSGTMTSLGHNLSSDATCLGGFWDLNVAAPLLGPLASNGGSTQTHMPQAGSAAINAVPLADCTDANSAPIAVDQRGVARPQAIACDIGSVEGTILEYAVKFVCGRAFPAAPVAPHPLAPGTYYTAINVHNPNTGTVNFNKKFAHALPNQTAGPVTKHFAATLNADRAFEVECAEITNKLGLPPLAFVTGFAVFQTAQELDIVAVYSAASTPTGPVVTLHTERVPKRP